MRALCFKLLSIIVTLQNIFPAIPHRYIQGEEEAPTKIIFLNSFSKFLSGFLRAVAIFITICIETQIISGTQKCYMNVFIFK